MADKSKMACNKPRRSDRAGKKKMVYNGVAVWSDGSNWIVIQAKST